MAGKKKFGQTVVGKALKGILGTIAPALQPLLQGEGVTVEGVISALKGDPGFTGDQKIALEAQILEAAAMEEEAVSKRWASDAMSDSWWSKNIRPLSYAFMTFMTFSLMIGDAYSVDFNLAKPWTDLIMYNYGIMTVGYFGGRTWEKIHKIKR